METENETWECKWCDWKGPTHELDKFGVHECCPKCRSMDVNPIKKPEISIIPDKERPQKSDLGILAPEKQPTYGRNRPN